MERTQPAESEDTDDVPDVLAAIFEFFSAWSSLAVQARVARGAGVDINKGDVGTLHALGRLGGRARSSVLADAAHLTRPTLTKSATRLLQSGLIERGSVVGDGRGAEIRLTAAGEEAYAGMVDAGIAIVRAAIEPFQAEDPAFPRRLSAFLRATSDRAVEVEP